METTKLLNSEFLDILFDDRNKDYGAYDLRRKYDKRVRNAVMGMSAIVVVIIGGYLISTNLIASDRNHEAFVAPETIKLETIKLDEPPPVYTPPPVKQIEPPVSQATVDAAIFRVTPDEEVRPEDEVPKNEALKEGIIGVANKDGDPNGVAFESDGQGLKGGTGVVEGIKAEVKEETFTIVEIMPEFPGGEKALIKFLQNNVHYPTMATEASISGTVFVKFVVSKNGEIGSVVIEGAKKGAGLEEEAMRVVRKMPKWKPGRQNGENVAVYFNLPIRFTLTEQ